jgi:hypothetical protein
MKFDSKQKYGIISHEVQASRGTSFFNNVQISWLLSEDFGLTICHLRCGVCLAPLESHAIKVGDEVFLVCEDAHLIGTETSPEHASALSAAIREQYQKEVQEKKLNNCLDYQNRLAELVAGRLSPKELRDWESDVPSREQLPRFTNHHEYNTTLERLISLFKEARFHEYPPR